MSQPRSIAERHYIGTDHLSLGARVLRAASPATALADLATLFRFRAIVHSLVTTQLSLRYQRSILGFFWTLLNPLLLLVVQALVFSRVLGIDPRNYALYLFSGLVFWQFFSTALEAGSRSLIANEGLIRRVATPLIVFPISDVLVSLVSTGFAVIALFVLFIALGAPFQPQLVLLVPGIAMLVAFTLGLALIAMVLVTFYRDFAHIIGVLLFAGYFATPIIYPATLAGGRGSILRYNPLTYYMEFFHDGLLTAAIITQNPSQAGGLWPDATAWIVGAVSAIAALWLGYVLYKINEREFIFRL
jgi:ABC-2 type transport system permease protein/lipopolysaccharide transport system permease protein